MFTSSEDPLLRGTPARYSSYKANVCWAVGEECSVGPGQSEARTEVKLQLPCPHWWLLCWPGLKGNMRMPGAGVPWWEHAVKKIMQPDRPFILAPHKGTMPGRKGPPTSGTRHTGSKDPVLLRPQTTKLSRGAKVRKVLHRRRQAEGIPQPGL